MNGILNREERDYLIQDANLIITTLNCVIAAPKWVSELKCIEELNTVISILNKTR